MKRDMRGLLMGIVTNGEEPGIAFHMVGSGETIAMGVLNAADIFNQLGDLLDTLGYFDEEECEECATKH